jgi:hypothetical protein
VTRAGEWHKQPIAGADYVQVIRLHERGKNLKGDKRPVTAHVDVFSGTANNTEGRFLPLLQGYPG